MNDTNIDKMTGYFRFHLKNNDAGDELTDGK